MGPFKKTTWDAMVARANRFRWSFNPNFVAYSYRRYGSYTDTWFSYPTVPVRTDRYWYKDDIALIQGLMTLFWEKTECPRRVSFSSIPRTWTQQKAAELLSALNNFYVGEAEPTIVLEHYDNLSIERSWVTLSAPAGAQLGVPGVKGQKLVAKFPYAMINGQTWTTPTGYLLSPMASQTLNVEGKLETPFAASQSCRVEYYPGYAIGTRLEPVYAYFVVDTSNAEFV